MNRIVDLFFGIEFQTGSIQCVAVLASNDQIQENVEIYSAMVITDDTSVVPLFPASFIVIDNDSKIMM